MSLIDDKTPCDETIDKHKRGFLVATASVLGSVGIACALKPLISSWSPAAISQAAAGPIQVDLSKLEPGQQITVTWRGKPVWIIRRTQDMLRQLSEHEAQLRDPDSMTQQQPPYAQNEYRSINPEYLVLIGICTHLGCIPKYKSHTRELPFNGAGGFYCPCHGSTFDMAGRVYKGVPAPINLEVPPYQFIGEQMIVIGQDEIA